ncbi:MAG TPA: hypothetical protein VES73_04405, partial [Lamprocystis sp. (in: g-proteobacteria)]|nr:hypothetical protein [Lamprocystis sp. (in: g-proteobacteria)]
MNAAVPFPAWLIPVAVGVVALGLALAINALVIARRPGRDSGALWTWVLVGTAGVLALSLLYGWALQWADAPWWSKGWHPFFDETGLRLDLPWLPTVELKVPVTAGTNGQPSVHPWWWALALPFTVWLLMVLGRLAVPPPGPQPGQPRRGSWLAGSAGFATSRRWVSALAAPMLLLLVWTADQLGDGPAHARAALWGTLAVTAITLIVIAFSRGRPAAGGTAPVEPETSAADWVAALRRRGLAVQTLARLEPVGDTPDTQDPAAVALLAQWPFLRERQVAPELVEAIGELFGADPGIGTGGRRQGLDRLILAPDDCGQLETLAAAIRLTHQRLEQVTLVICPHAADALARRLTPWLPGRVVIQVPLAQTAVDPTAMVWVLTAGTLSDRLADLSDHASLLNRIGLIAWWDLDAYSGVLAANVWAVSHRLHRLIKGKGHPETRSLCFARYHPSHETNFAAFTAQLLPYEYRTEDRVVVAPRRRHPVCIHLLEPTPDLRPRDPVQQDHGDPSLLAARTSVEAGWRTRYEPPPGLDLIRTGDFLQQRVDGRRLGRQLPLEPVDAGARIMEIGAAEVLSLGNLLAQGGRCLGHLSAHHVGLFLPPGNPYVRHLLGRLQQDPAAFFRLTRRLIPGAPQPAIIRRHLLLALREMEAVATGLLTTFQWRDAILDPVLEDLANHHQVERRDVRFLDDDNRLKVDTGYSSSVAEYRPGPLDTVGEQLVSVILREAGEAEELLVRIDPERATIVAYPRRVFQVKGQTYRMNPWPTTDAQEIKRRGVLYCTRTDDPVLTWRVSEPRLRRSALDPSQNQAFFAHNTLNKVVIQTWYEEEVSGLIEVRRDAPPGTAAQSETDWGEPITGLSFPTQGLLLRFLEEDIADQPAALHSIAQAFSQVLAVHVGVEADAVCVIAAERLKIG